MAEKPTLMFIHGLWTRPRIWDSIRSYFEERGYTTLAPALPCHDLTPLDPVPTGLGTLSLLDYSASLEAEIRQISGPVVLIGHGTGALLAQMAATRTVPAGLVLLSPVPSADMLTFAWQPLRTCWPLISRWGFWDEALALPRDVALEGMFNGVPAAEALHEFGELVHESGRAFAEVAFGAIWSSAPSRVVFSRIEAPSLIIVGTEDRLTPPAIARSTARHLTSSVQYRELDGVGHWVFHEAVRDRITTLMSDFLVQFDEVTAHTGS